MFAQQNKLLCKAIFVGDTNTGKTCLLNRLVDKVFTDTTPTLGSSLKFESVILNKKIHLNVSFLDTSGQEKYHAINKIYYKPKLTSKYEQNLALIDQRIKKIKEQSK